METFWQVIDWLGLHCLCIADPVLPGLADSLTAVADDYSVGAQPSAVPSGTALVGTSRYVLASTLP